MGVAPHLKSPQIKLRGYIVSVVVLGWVYTLSYYWLFEPWRYLSFEETDTVMQGCVVRQLPEVKRAKKNSFWGRGLTDVDICALFEEVVRLLQV